MRCQRVAPDRVAHVLRDASRQNVLRATRRVLRLVVVEFEMIGGDDVDDVSRLAANDGTRQLVSGDEMLDHDVAVSRRGDGADGLRRTVGASARNDDADARSFGHRLRNVRRFHHMTGERFLGRHNHAARNRHADALHDVLSALLVHRNRGREYA